MKKWLNRLILASFIAVAIVYGGSKPPSPRVTKDNILTVSNANFGVVTNVVMEAGVAVTNYVPDGTLHLEWSVAPLFAAVVPASAAVHIDRTPDRTNWTAVASSTVGAGGWGGLVPGLTDASDVTNNQYFVYVDWSPVHTNGVYNAYVSKYKNRYIPIRVGFKKDDSNSRLEALRARIRAATGDPNAEIVEYIENTGNSGIDTGIEIQRNATINIELSIFDSSDQTAIPIGAFANKSSGHRFGFNFSRVDGPTQIIFNYGMYHRTGILVEDGRRYALRGLFHDGEPRLFVDGIAVPLDCDFMTQDYDSTHIYLFRNGSSNPSKWYFRGRIWSCEIFIGKTIPARNLVPVFVSGRYKMFDLVSGTLMQNKDDGVFSISPVVTSVDQLTDAQREAWGLK